MAVRAACNKHLKLFNKFFELGYEAQKKRYSTRIGKGDKCRTYKTSNSKSYER